MDMNTYALCTIQMFNSINGIYIYIYIVQLQVYCIATCVEYIRINNLILLVDNGHVDMAYRHICIQCMHAYIMIT
jgi:hypothetical protein